MDFCRVPIRYSKKGIALLDKPTNDLLLKGLKLSCNPLMLVVYGRSFSCHQYGMSALHALSVAVKFRAIYKKEETG